MNRASFVTKMKQLPIIIGILILISGCSYLEISNRIANSTLNDSAQYFMGNSTLNDSQFTTADIKYEPRIIISCSNMNLSLDYGNYTINMTMKDLCDRIR